MKGLGPARRTSLRPGTHRSIRTLRDRRGFTLLEIVITVSIIVFLFALGIGAVTDLLPRYRARQAALQFAAHVGQLRNRAVTDGVEYRVCLIEYDDDLKNGDHSKGEYWLEAGDRSLRSQTWDTLPVDDGDAIHTDGRIDLAEDGGPHEIPDVSIDEWTTLSGPDHGSGAESNQDCIVISPRGWVTNPNEDFGSSGYITVSFVNKLAAMKERSEVYEVSVARSGFARVDYSTASRFDDVASSTIGVDEASSVESSEASGGE